MHDVPKPVFPDGAVFVTQAVTQRSYLLPWLAGDKRWRTIPQFRRCFADPFEATLNRIVRFPIFAERHPVDTGCVTLNGLRVFDDVFKAAGEFVRRQGRGLCRSPSENVFFALVLR